MADLKTIGNCAQIVMLAASFVLWAAMIRRGLLRRPPLELAAREPVSWPALPVCATFLVAFFLPLFVVHLAGPIKSLSPVQVRCAANVVQMLAVVLLLSCAGPVRSSDFGLRLTHWRVDLAAGATGFLASLAPVFLVILAVEKLRWRGKDDEHSLLKILDASPDPAVLFWVVLAAVVVGPLAEELLYRVVLQGWSQSQVSPGKAIIFSSAIFCLAHQTADVLPLAPLALILGYVYYRRQSYFAVVVLHALFNGFMLALAVLTRE